MFGLRVTVPIACFRKGLAREYLETEMLPPPATCYGFLLSLVGETRRLRHVGCRVCPALLNQPEMSTVLRTVWRVKSRPLGSAGNTRPDYQQLLTPVEAVIWLDSTEETSAERLEDRVSHALERPDSVVRFGGLSLGESTHLVDEVSRFDGDPTRQALFYLLSDTGRVTLPVWVDHVGSAGTRHVTGDLVQRELVSPPRDRMPRIESKENAA
jgi:CRISPR-associated protein Cas5t